MTQTATNQTATWWDQAVCRDLPPEWFGHADDAFEEPEGAEESWEPDPRAQAFCLACPVRPECLAVALHDPELRGTWGGTSWHQRRQLRRVRARLACSVCASTDTTTVGAYQYCKSCAMSWRT